jgi:electron transfer flavoprotein beta subunit
MTRWRSDAIATARALAAALQKLDIDGATARIERPAEIGYQVAEAATPALVSVMKSINEPRYPSMKGIMQSKKKPIDTMSLADLGLDASQVGAAGAREQALSADAITTQRKGEMYIGTDGAADRIVAYLVEQKVL